jgi:hypothetical protein
MPENSRPPTATEIAQIPPPPGQRSYSDVNTGHMVFELQGTIGELKESIAALTRSVEKGFTRIDEVERSSGEIKNTLRGLVPKIDDLAGFAKHRAPNLADKYDMVRLQADLKAEIDKRPTRRQSVMDAVMIVGFFGTVLAIGSKLAH